MAITTTSGHCLKALAFYNNTNLYFGVGRQTAWADENTPDVPSISITCIEDPLGFKKIDSKYLVVPDVNGTIMYDDGSTWSIVSPSDIYTKGAKWVYVSCSIKSTELPLNSYRQVGILLNLVVSDSAYANNSVLLPSQVSSQGTLYLVDNKVETVRKLNQKEILSFIIEF